MASSVPALTFNLKLSHLLGPRISNTHMEFIEDYSRKPRGRRRLKVVNCLANHHFQHYCLNPKSMFKRSVLTRVSNDGGGKVDATPQQPVPSVSFDKKSSVNVRLIG